MPDLRSESSASRELCIARITSTRKHPVSYCCCFASLGFAGSPAWAALGFWYHVR
jgi:hypothetical protein